MMLRLLAYRRSPIALWASLALASVAGSCKGPAAPVVTTECPPAGAALRSAPLGPAPAAEHLPAAPALPAVHPFHRCFLEDTALSAPRPLAALLDHAADLYEQAIHLMDDVRPASREAASGAPSRAAPPALAPRVADLLTSALLCSEEATRVEPRSVEAHHGRAIALQELGRIDEARDAITRALAVDPDDPETLAAAADLYINRLTQGTGPNTGQNIGIDHAETGLEFARRGSRRARRSHDKALVSRLALLEGQALNDLGRAREALARLDASLSAVDDVQARYERAVALFDLCRFAEARRGFDDVVTRVPDDAWAHHHLGLVLEFLGRNAEADQAFARARREAPQEFHEPLPVDPEEFRLLVQSELAALPAALRADLWAVRVETADLPDVADLTAEEPPLSPTILGLFRGTPLGASPDESGDTEARAVNPGLRTAHGPAAAPAGGPPAPVVTLTPAPPPAPPAPTPTASDHDEPRTIVLYRRNLLRATSTRDELQLQVRTTLLHELGHLHGEDDEVLRARGLE